MELLAYSSHGSDSRCRPSVGYVKLNGNVVWLGSWCGSFSNPRGINLLEIDPFICAPPRQVRQYDTHASSTDARQLIDYIRYRLDDGSVIVGVTADEPQQTLSDALPALRQLGVDVDDLHYRGSFAFIAQKGYRAKTALSTALNETESTRAPAHVNALITGAQQRD